MNRLSQVRPASVLFLAMLASLAAMPVFAKLENLNSLVGLWEGVDTLDGSTIRVAIGDVERDKRLEFRWQESFLTECFNESNPQGRGLIAGTVERLNPDDVVFVVTRFVCYDNDGNEFDVDTFTVDLSYSPEEDTLTSATTAEFPGFILYRTSRGGNQ